MTLLQKPEIRLIHRTDSDKARSLAFVAAMRAWWLRRKTVNQLKRLPDHLLRDIGVERVSIEALARELVANGPVRPRSDLTLVTISPAEPESSAASREAA